MTDNQPHYIDKKEMYDEIVKSNQQGKPTEKLGEMFFKLAEKYSHHPWFRDYERKYGHAFKQDLIASGLYACVKAWDKFDYTKYDNPFSFFTTCLYRAYIGYLSKEYKQSNTKNALKVEIGLRGDYGYEEMIKEQEAREMEEDEANLAEAVIREKEEEVPNASDFDFGTDEEDEDIDAAKIMEEKSEQVDDLMSWRYDDDLEVDSESTNLNDMFGIKTRRRKRQ